MDGPRRLGSIAGLIVVVCGLAAPASAQLVFESFHPGEDTPPAEIAAALSLNAVQDVNVRPLCTQMALPCLSPKSAPDFGWALAGARNFTNGFAVAGELGAFNNTWDSWQSARSTHREENGVFVAAIGPRIATRFFRTRARSAPGGSVLRVFGQALVGVQASELAPTARAIQTGAGVDLATKRGAIVRCQFDYRFVERAGRNLPGSRVLIGLVAPIGDLR